MLIHAEKRYKGAYTKGNVTFWKNRIITLKKEIKRIRDEDPEKGEPVPYTYEMDGKRGRPSKLSHEISRGHLYC